MTQKQSSIKMKKTIVFCLFVSLVSPWKLPTIPNGRRSQFYILNEDGGYKYGYDTGRDYFAKQIADSANEVSGHYGYRAPHGEDVDVRYTAGIGGFLPEKAQPGRTESRFSYSPSFPYKSEDISDISDTSDQSNTGDASYSFTIDTDNYKRHEVSDAFGNIHGKYSYTDEAGHHELNYIAGANTGFVANPEESYTHTSQTSKTSFPSTSIRNPDGSYSFEFSTSDQTRKETADESGNVKGRYSYRNKEGFHDLDYVAGAQTGFLPIGGSLATPNGLENKNTNLPEESYKKDASYRFIIDTDDYKREEVSDAEGNVRGSYSYRDEAGEHELSYIAGDKTGFLPTGGSLAIPNGLNDKLPTIDYIHNLKPSNYITASPLVQTEDFIINTPEYQKQQSLDLEGNLKDRYSYNLENIAGKNQGFVGYAGSLNIPNGIPESNNVFVPTISSRYLPPQAIHSHENKNKVGNVLLKTYYPSKSQTKYGYIYESV